MELKHGLNVGYGLSRVAFGLVAIAAPKRLGRTWVGDDADSAGAEVLLRSLGVRDIALGGGAAFGARSGVEVETWLATCVLADLGDVAGTLAGRGGLPEKGVRNTVAIAGLAALAGFGLIALNRSED